MGQSTDAFRAEMEAIFPEIQAVQAEIRQVEEELRVLVNTITVREQHYSEARSGPDQEEADSWARTLNTDYRIEKELNSKLRELKINESALLERHSAAKEKWRNNRAGEWGYSEEADAFRAEMEAIFPEIQAVQAEIRQVEEELSALIEIITEREEYYQEARSGPDQEEAHSWGRTLDIDYAAEKELNSKLRQLKDNESALQERYNAAKSYM